MRQTLALAFVFVAIVVAFSALYFASPASDAREVVPSDFIAQVDTGGTGDSGQGEIMAQVIQKVIPQGPPAPEIASSTWLNSPALAPQDLRGHVVVVEFWTHG